MRPSVLVGFALAVVAATAVSPSRACAVAYPQGEFARLAGERAVIVWDAAHKTEHFIRKPTFDGDARRFGFFVPTPVVPKVAKAPDETFDRIADLLEPPAQAGHGEPRAAAASSPGAAVEVLQRVHIDDFTLDTIKSTSADALIGWLHANGYAVRAGLGRWAAPYLAKGWVITAMRYAASSEAPVAMPDGGAHAPQIDTPTLRFSFAIDAPFYPYREPPVDQEDRSGFLARRGQLAMDSRPLYVWLVADRALEAFQGDQLSGPYLHASARVPAAKLGAALGATREWGFDPASRPEWTVTYLTQFEERPADAQDVTFAPAKVLATAAAPAAKVAPAEKPSHRKRALAGAGLAVLLVAALFVYLELRPKRA